MATRASICAVSAEMPPRSNTAERRCASSRSSSSRPAVTVAFQAYHSGMAKAARAASPMSTVPSAQVAAEERRSLFMLAHHVARVAHRAHQRRLAVEFDLGAQLADVHVDH